jgi:hypothetical protein
MLKLASKNIPIKQKTVSVSCGNCTKLTEIEGQKVCFENGKITRLIKDPYPAPLLKMYCNAWQKDKTKFK